MAAFPDEDVMEELEDWVADLNGLYGGAVVIVEGRKDVEALRSLGVEVPVRPLNRGMGAIDFIEELMGRPGATGERPASLTVVILTDWDRKGGFLASRLKKACLHLGMDHDLEFRRRLKAIAGRWLKDVESFPTFIKHLGG